MAAVCEGEIKRITLITAVSSTTSNLCYSPKHSFSHYSCVDVWGCWRGFHVSDLLSLDRAVMFPCLFPQVGESQRPSETLINSYRSAFQEGQGGCFLPGEHYANSVVKHIGIVLPFASAVLADSTGAFSQRSGHRGLVLGRERFSCSLCYCHTQEMCL